MAVIPSPWEPPVERHYWYLVPNLDRKKEKKWAKEACLLSKAHGRLHIIRYRVVGFWPCITPKLTVWIYFIGLRYVSEEGGGMSRSGTKRASNKTVCLKNWITNLWPPRCWKGAFSEWPKGLLKLWFIVGPMVGCKNHKGTQPESSRCGVKASLQGHRKPAERWVSSSLSAL